MLLPFSKCDTKYSMIVIWKTDCNSLFFNSFNFGEDIALSSIKGQEYILSTLDTAHHLALYS